VQRRGYRGSVAASAQRVLVVEDDPAIARVLELEHDHQREHLSRHRPASASSSRDGQGNGSVRVLDGDVLHVRASEEGFGATPSPRRPRSLLTNSDTAPESQSPE
jgi:hypothetical protein